MKVKTLIEKLKKMPQNATVKLHDRRLGEELLLVIAYENDDENVVLETESDVDMAEEISARFSYAIENGEDELDVYYDMLKQGITPEMVENYYSEDAATHMREFCESHGLL